MKHALTLANINLYAVMRNLEDLCEIDDEMKDLISQKNLTVQLTVRNGPMGRLIFRDGHCRFERGKGPSDIKLYFRSPKHFNRMVDGDGAPMITKGFTKLGFLTKDFTALTDRLSYYLKPTEALLSNPEYVKVNTTLSAYTAFFALAEIGNTDPVGRHSGQRIADGLIAIHVSDGPAIGIEAKDGHLLAKKGMPSKYRAAMSFTDMKTAGDLLNGKIDSYSCIACKKLKLNGFIPMLDNMNKLLGQVPNYL